MWVHTLGDSGASGGGVYGAWRVYARRAIDRESAATKVVLLKNRNISGELVPQAQVCLMSQRGDMGSGLDLREPRPRWGQMSQTVTRGLAST